MSIKKLTEKQIQYKRNRAKGMSRIDSAVDAYPEANRKTASVIAAKNEKNPNIAKYIQHVYNIKGMGVEQIVDEIIKGIKGTDYKEKIQYLRTAIDMSGFKAPNKQELEISEKELLDQDKDLIRQEVIRQLTAQQPN